MSAGLLELPTGPEPARPAGRGRVLILEDDAIQALDLELAFEEMGYEVIGPALDAAHALELIDRHAPTLATIDYNLRHGTSSAVARALAHEGIDFIYITASANELRGDVSCPPAPIFSKPVDPRHMLAALPAHLHAH